MSLGKDYFYGCLGPELFEINPRRRGVEITITEISSGQKHSVILTSTAFRRLIAEGYDILQEVDALRDEATRIQNSVYQKGNQ